jgi:hypothetical protein
MRLHIQVVNPIDRGRPPRNINMRDIISVPAVQQAGTVPVIDNISDDSIRNLIIAYSRSTGPDRKRRRMMSQKA